MTQEHHYFAETAYSWATAETAQDALAKVAQAIPAAQWKRLQATHGVQAEVIRIERPLSDVYEVGVDGPKGVPMRERTRGLITHRDGRFSPMLASVAPLARKPENMPPEQFEALAELMRLRPGNIAREALRLGAVEGLEREQVIEQTGISQQALTNATKRFADALVLAKQAAGVSA